MRVALITNIPAPYRIPVFDRVADRLGARFRVIYCAEREPNRQWDLPRMEHDHIYPFRLSQGFVHANPSIPLELESFAPDVVITSGLAPSFLLGFFWAKARRRPHIAFSDGTIHSERDLSKWHRMIRMLVYSRSAAFLAPSLATESLFRSYGAVEQSIFRSVLAVNNGVFKRPPEEDRLYDLMFSGQFIERKMPLFFADLLERLKKKRSDCRVLILGDGPLKEDFFIALDRANIDYHWAGFVAQRLLPELYGSSKLFVFPTLSDPWGVVANEAMAAGTPVITCSNAGVSGDLVIDGVNGLILPLDVEPWAEEIDALLSHEDRRIRMAKAAIEKVAEYTFESAADGIIKSARYALERERNRS